MNNPKFVRLSVRENNVGVGDFHFILRFSGFSVIENRCDVGCDVCVQFWYQFLLFKCVLRQLEVSNPKFSPLGPNHGLALAVSLTYSTPHYKNDFYGTAS